MGVLSAINLRKDYRYLIIYPKGKNWAVSWESNQLRPFLSKNNEEVFKTLKAAKAYCCTEFQNPKWGDKYPKLKWEETTISQVRLDDLGGR